MVQGDGAGRISCKQLHPTEIKALAWELAKIVTKAGYKRLYTDELNRDQWGYEDQFGDEIESTWDDFEIEALLFAAEKIEGIKK